MDPWALFSSLKLYNLLLFPLPILTYDMIKKDNIKYSYNDIFLVPSKVSDISHRSECDPFVDHKFILPLFTAPMSSVVSLENYESFMEQGIIPILPRNIDYQSRLEYSTNGSWAAFSLQEFKDTFCGGHLGLDIKPGIFRALIDIANGHMSDLYNAVKRAKDKRGDKIQIMVGNIANPETYRVCEAAGVDYVRCGIGSGAGCITSSNTSVHYPMASLIEETYAIKSEIHGKCMIIADGGIRGYADIIKALALGADYVMIGSVFAKMLESSGKTYFCYPDSDRWREFKFDSSKHKYESGKFYDLDTSTGMWDEIKLRKEFYGMASAKGQIAISGKKTKTSEGLTRMVPVEYTMSSWTNNFKDYLRSAMSYTGSHTLEDFIGKQDLVVISENTYNSVNR